MRALVVTGLAVCTAAAAYASLVAVDLLSLAGLWPSW